MQVLLKSVRGCRPKGDAAADKTGGSIRSHRSIQAMTLPEVVMAVAIIAFVFGGTIQAYIQTGQRIEWSGYSLAAQSLAQETIEQARSAVWDPAQYPAVNQMTNLPVLASTMSYDASSQTWSGYMTNILDVPYSGTDFVVATNFVKVQMVYVNGLTNVLEQFIRVDCVWPFRARSGVPCFTNTVCTMVAPDNRDPSTF